MLLIESNPLCEKIVFEFFNSYEQEKGYIETQEDFESCNFKLKVLENSVEVNDDVYIETYSVIAALCFVFGCFYISVQRLRHSIQKLHDPRQRATTFEQKVLQSIFRLFYTDQQKTEVFRAMAISLIGIFALVFLDLLQCVCNCYKKKQAEEEDDDLEEELIKKEEQKESPESMMFMMQRVITEHSIVEKIFGARNFHERKEITTEHDV
eukprot:snap_masked-scaffold_45-processed-gene-1.65-mRNA-1 protein AED:1.00 eAED:1.00 QI:0/0/0/0/1/1/2/0/208